ncbi:MAG: hypothetical protein JWM85_1302 [Acidimicrobiaceae bacterium]|nr:hypothetical protein [Acidimicrobiaceae bacterium]
MSRNARISIAGALFAVAVGLVVMTVMAFLRSSPPTVNFASGHQAGKPLDLTVQTVGSIGYGEHPTWVSYLIKAPDGRWVHTTLWDVPPNTRLNVTILQFDSGSPLRNPFLGLYMTGPKGSPATLNGKPIQVVDATQGNGVGHTFSIPALNVNVPLPGVDGNAKNFCNAAPCQTNEAHNTVQFSFVTPGSGSFRWQCFVPCGLAYLFGNGGPMQTIGYMDGFLTVVPA